MVPLQPALLAELTTRLSEPSGREIVRESPLTASIAAALSPSMATSSRIRVTSPAPGSTRTVPRRLPESVYVPGSLTSNRPLELSRSIDALSADSVAKAATEQSEQARIAAKTEASSFFMMLYLLLSRCFRLRSQHERQVEILSANRFLHRIFANALLRVQVHARPPNMKRPHC